MAKDFNDPQVIESYNQHIRKLIPGYELIHLQVNAILNAYLVDNSPENTVNILIVGCGTGYELQYLAEKYPTWHFTAIDPALGMLEQAKKHIQSLALEQQITFIHADTTALQSLDLKFDAAVAILVSHFVAFENKLDFFKDIYACLKPQGICLSYDFMQIETQQELEILKILTQSIGLSQAQSQAMADRLMQDFDLCSISELQDFYRQANFTSVKSFAQVLNYYGLIAIKSAKQA